VFTRLGAFEGGPESRRAALLDFCAETLDIPRRRLALAHDPLGAPLLLVDAAPGAWRVSSASRENVYCFGLTRDRAIGVDVEIVRPIATPEAVLHPSERRRLAALGAAAFYELWTVKEAYVKALGVGLRRDPAEIEVIFAPLAIRDAERPVALAGARVWSERVDGKCAVCAALTL